IRRLRSEARGPQIHARAPGRHSRPDHLIAPPTVIPARPTEPISPAFLLYPILNYTGIRTGSLSPILMPAKQLIFDESARRKILRGIETLSRAVKVTLGPKGRHVVIDKK